MRWDIILKHRIAETSRQTNQVAHSLIMRFLTVTLAVSLVAKVTLTPPLVKSNASAQTSGNSGTIRFEDTAAKAGLRFTTQNSPTANKNQIETMVAGVALIDYDGDGWLDIYLVNGAAIPSLQKESPRRSPGRYPATRLRHSRSARLRQPLFLSDSCLQSGSSES